MVCDRENFWETLEEIEPGALARLYSLVQTHRWELIFLTSRPETRETPRRRRAIAGCRNTVTCSHRCSSCMDRAARLPPRSRSTCSSTIVPENCLDVAIDSSARAILVWRGDANNVPGSARQLGIGAVGSMAECLDILESLDRPDANQLGMVERLKRLLGLKPQAARLKQPGRPASRRRQQARSAG